MRSFCIILLISIFCGGKIVAQSHADSTALSGDGVMLITQLKNKDVATYGSIEIKQDAQIEKLIAKHIRISKAENKISGWRIQIYNSSGKEARDEANEFRNKFLAKYPELRAYLVYQPPYFKIRVGDFLSKPDAFRLYKDVLKEFPVSYLVPDKINFPQMW